MRREVFKKGTLLLLSIVVLFFAATNLWAEGKQEEGAEKAEAEKQIMKIGSQPVNNLDPHFATSIADIMLLEQQYHHLTFINPENRPEADLAKSWGSPNGKVWTFDLKEGIKFNNGEEVTAEDVVYSFDRLRDPDVGSPVVQLYKNIDTIEAVNDYEVRFTLTEKNPEFPADAGDYHAAIVPAGTENPGDARIGSGPFMITDYYPEDRIILKQNPHFSETDDQGNQLPYMDELHIIFSPQLSGQVQSLRGGELHFVGGLTTEFADAVEKASGTKLLTNESNMHWVIHMRCDGDRIVSDNRVRRALKLATDHQEIIDAVRPGYAVPGNGYTPVGPAYGPYYLDEAPERDVEKAKQLLADAGYPDGFEFTLYAQDQLDVPNIATVWKQQLADIGVTVNIQIIPSDVYFGDGPKSWLKCDFGITDWGARATPVTYFKLAYMSDAPWNESHWSNEEFDEVAQQIDREMDDEKRVELYKKAQRIMIEEGPIVVPYFEVAVAGVASNLTGVELASDWARTRFWTAQFK
jgi:peptide/nickel transport system substrate-binding protein